MTNAQLRNLLVTAQFWALACQFAVMLGATLVEARRVPVQQRTVRTAMVLGLFAWLLTAAVAPRTNRIFYDEQIYQGVGRSLSDLRLAQMCNDGSVEYGRLQCARGEYNKQPYGYPFLLSLVYNVFGVSDAAAFRMNNVVAGLTVFVTVVLAALLFNDFYTSAFGGLALALVPMLLTWSNTAAAEPSAALFCAIAWLATVHFTRVRTTSALVWAVAAIAFAITMRPECVLMVPLAALTITVLARPELRRPRLWWGALGGLALTAVSILHMIAVRNEGWGATGDRAAWQYAVNNVRTNFWFYVADERFPALVTIAAVVGTLAIDRVRERLVTAAYFAAFWTIFVFFYAGSYNYGADVRYSLMTYVPLAILAGAGFARVGRWLTARWPERQAYGAVAGVVLAQSVAYLPLVRATGEEAWAARADVRYARAFAERLPPNAIVLTHNPSMFHVWGISAAQLSIAATSRSYADEYLASRYAGGVYVHWNYWCNVSDRVQQAFCQTVLETFPHETIDVRRERNYTYALYRLVLKTAK